MEPQKYSCHVRKRAKCQPKWFYCSFALFEVEFTHKKMRTIKVNVLTQSGHIDSSLKWISFILGIYYLLNIHLKAGIDLCIRGDRYIYICSKHTHMNAFHNFYCRACHVFQWRPLLSTLLYKQHSQYRALLERLGYDHSCGWRWHPPPRL